MAVLLSRGAADRLPPTDADMSTPTTTLRPAAFNILLALAGADLHGLGIAEEVEHITRGAMQLGPGTLYRSLKELARDGLIREIALGDDVDPRRKVYRATAAGRRALAEEAARLERLVDAARARDVLPGSR